MMKIFITPTEAGYNISNKSVCPQPVLIGRIVHNTQRTEKYSNYRRRTHPILFDSVLLIASLCKKSRQTHLLQELHPQLFRQEQVANKDLFMSCLCYSRQYFHNLQKHFTRR